MRTRVCYGSLRAEGTDRTEQARSRQQAVALPEGISAIGCAFEMYFSGGQSWVRGKILAYISGRGPSLGGAHLVLYEDGESEWLHFSMEDVHLLPEACWVPADTALLVSLCKVRAAFAGVYLNWQGLIARLQPLYSGLHTRPFWLDVGKIMAASFWMKACCMTGYLNDLMGNHLWAPKNWFVVAS